ncbi:hypothetical protein [Pseudomonas sp. R76]|uniref:hypothetical protein n=1 Tax=Pseudomonas sp. R76 TaxID=1573711 RepID=UPI00131F527E|nr:hypothetical protein [Pseudomonas sp. R76]QHD08133.1 hypothetical protein PspR76_21585 [Pseudomonas sp. R76]
MITRPTHRLCNRCGDWITAYCPSVETLSTLGIFHEAGDQAVVDEIVRRENIDPAIVWEYFEHRMKPRCTQMKISSAALKWLDSQACALSL